MGLRNKQRRAAKAKDRQRNARERAARGPVDADLIDLDVATRARWVHDKLIGALNAVDLERPDAAIAQAQALAHATGKPDFAALIDCALVEVVSRQVPQMWKRG